jgi:hypothetical protein
MTDAALLYCVHRHCGLLGRQWVLRICRPADADYLGRRIRPNQFSLEVNSSPPIPIESIKDPALNAYANLE